jgi:hypothetical protein
MHLFLSEGRAEVAYTHARTNKQGNTDLGQLAQNQFVTHPDLSADYS